VFLVITGCGRGAPPEKQQPVQHSNGLSAAEPEKPTAEQLLRKTAAVYQDARTYSDRGEVQFVGTMNDPAEKPPRWACTVAFERPGKLRLEVSDGKLVSDGENCFAQIRAMPEQVLFFRTPERWTLDTVFSDLYLAQAMTLGFPETLMRFPPQLILLLADDPLKTLLPDGATAELLEPQKVGETLCDLIKVSHSGGSRILYIARNNHALLRFDYLVEGLAVPPGVESVRLIRIDMPDADFDRYIEPESFQMEQPKNARQVSEFLPSDAPELSAQRQEEHRQQLKTMRENGYYALPPLPEPADATPAPAKMPKTFRLNEQWNLPLLGIENITVVPQKNQQDILVPCEGNLLAQIDAAGKIVQKIQPKGLQNDELLTRIRTAADGTGKQYVGVSSVSGQTVHLFDSQFVPVPQTAPKELKPVKQTVVSDFQFVKFSNGTLAVLTGQLSLDNTGSDVLRLTAPDGTELWRDNSVRAPFLVHSYIQDGKQEILVLSVQEKQSLLLKSDVHGQRLGALPFAGEREILWFAVSGSEGGIYAIHSDRDGSDVRIAGLDFNGKTQWEHRLPSGEYQKPIDQIIIGDLLGDAAAEILVPLPDGTVFVFDRKGTLLDEFAFGRFLSGLAVLNNGLLVADPQGITAYKLTVSTPPDSSASDAGAF
ncbi:MAG: hypothetical protein LBN39_04125, partial [Planctomycetaceae bacterium]|nr:hypothetical protein [Planctomycetaceae bacterium]